MDRFTSEELAFIQYLIALFNCRFNLNDDKEDLKMATCISHKIRDELTLRYMPK